MRMALGVFGMLATLVSTEVSAQPAVNLTGEYRCVRYVSWVMWVASICHSERVEYKPAE
jgi:hypothetical protein